MFYVQTTKVNSYQIIMPRLKEHLCDKNVRKLTKCNRRPLLKIAQLCQESNWTLIINLNHRNIIGSTCAVSCLTEKQQHFYLSQNHKDIYYYHLNLAVESKRQFNVISFHGQH